MMNLYARVFKLTIIGAIHRPALTKPRILRGGYGWYLFLPPGPTITGLGNPFHWQFDKI
jgi:hypothetical protein